MNISRKMSNIFSILSELPNEELCEPIVVTNKIVIERIVSTGQITTPGEWYDQQQDEWVILLQGEAELSYDNGDRLKLVAGDYLLIPAHQKHRVDYTSSDPICIWLAIHTDLNCC